MPGRGLPGGVCSTRGPGGASAAAAPAAGRQGTAPLRAALLLLRRQRCRCPGAGRGGGGGLHPRAGSRGHVRLRRAQPLRGLLPRCDWAVPVGRVGGGVATRPPCAAFASGGQRGPPTLREGHMIELRLTVCVYAEVALGDPRSSHRGGSFTWWQRAYEQGVHSSWPALRRGGRRQPDSHSDDSTSGRMTLSWRRPHNRRRLRRRRRPCPHRGLAIPSKPASPGGHCPTSKPIRRCFASTR